MKLNTTTSWLELILRGHGLPAVPDYLEEVRFWAAYREQTVARTIRGALSYHQSLHVLKIAVLNYYLLSQDLNFDSQKAEQWCRYFVRQGGLSSSDWEGAPDCDDPQVRSQIWEKLLSASKRLNLGGKVAAQVVWGHQTLASASKINRKKDENLRKDVTAVLRRHREFDISVVFDLNNTENGRPRDLCRGELLALLRTLEFTKHITCIAQLSHDTQQLSVKHALPRRYPLRLGKGDFATQGKSANQVNCLRATTGLCIQTLDANQVRNHAGLLRRLACSPMDIVGCVRCLNSPCQLRSHIVHRTAPCSSHCEQRRCFRKCRILARLSLGPTDARKIT